MRRSVEAADATVDAFVEDRRNTLVTLLGDLARNYIELAVFSGGFSSPRLTLNRSRKRLISRACAFRRVLPVISRLHRRKDEFNTTAAQIPTFEKRAC